MRWEGQQPIFSSRQKITLRLTSKPSGGELRVGIRWRSGAAEEHTVEQRRPRTRAGVARTLSEVVEFVRRLAPEHTDTEIAERLNAVGMFDRSGGRFVAGDVQGIRWRHRIPYATAWVQDGELTVGQVAERLDISTGTVYGWIKTGKLLARRGPANRLYVPFSSKVEKQCRKLVQNSVHITR